MPPRAARDRVRCTSPAVSHAGPAGIPNGVNPSSVERILSRLFRPVAKVEPREASTAAVMMVTAFLLLTAYYLLKTVREPLILLQGGAEVKLYARAAQAVLMVGFVHLYGEVARRVGRMKLLAIVFLFFISNLIVFALLAYAKVRIGLAFFLWLGVFSYTVVAQFWAFAADIHTEEQGKRIFPVLALGSSTGAVVGARIAKSLMPLGLPVLMGAAAGILLLCVSLIIVVERRAAAVVLRSRDPHPDKPLADQTAFQLLASDRYLLLIGVLVILLNWVNSAGEYMLDRTLLRAVSEARAAGTSPEAFVGAFKADYFAWYNLLGMLLQFFAVSRILVRLGVRNALLFLPGFALLGYGCAAVVPVLAIVRLVKIGENSLQYSLQDTARHALFLVTSRVEKYVGKTAVETIAVRIGAILSAATVWVGTHTGMPTAGFAMVNVALVVMWIAVVFAIGREQARRAGETEEQIAAEPVPS
jgi:ATP:ADP antiporter, AAA family